MQEYNSILLT